LQAVYDVVYHIVYSHRLHAEYGTHGKRSGQKGDDDVQGESSGGPAKERYDRKRPVVSFRVSRNQLEKLDALVKGSGMSKGRFLRRAFGLELEKKDEVYRKGHRDGYRKAKEEYSVDVFCNAGDGLIPVRGDDMKIKIRNAISKVYNVYHRDCKPQNMADDKCELFDREVSDE
jgi:hypothetical protein